MQYLQAQADRLAGFSESIQQCLETEAWDNLQLVLEARHQYLEIMFAEPMQGEIREEALALAEQIIQQDKKFTRRVTEQRDRVRQQQLSLANGKKAVHAYHSETIQSA
ncbi:MAG: hypothetical protein CTY34_05565 [Methylobacter sp.]|nr:MAG: hypothetical protein CTY34_05565 [Methylobacter sp.]PPD03852.1 MAG: hypothetical protein CTY29_08010 [Methylobacter sp.]PPD21379.1 MAG: hypothetical protein CTY24_07950 [Methylobacter sp.]